MMETLGNLFHQGGPLFMGILTILLIVILAMAVTFSIIILTGKSGKRPQLRHWLTYLKSVGLFTMITGILGQLIGLVMAFSAIERAGDISPAMIYGGLKVSMYTTLYGILVYMLSIIIWFVLDLLLNKKTEISNE